MTLPEFECLREQPGVIVRKEDDRESERKSSLARRHHQELWVLHDEAHIPHGYEYKPNSASKQDKVAVGPSLHLFDICVQMEHPEHHVQSISELTKAGTMVPTVDQIVPVVISIVVISIIWNRVWVDRL